MIRKPAVAGHFYPADPKKLEEELRRCLAGTPPSTTAPKKKAIGIVAPHAGYKYSGAVAGCLYRQIELPRRFIILSPNHTGHGKPFSIMPRGHWEMPLGPASIDEPLASRFMKNCPFLEEDTGAHAAEHSLEVQIPFLQYLKKDFSFVPVTLSYIPFEHCRLVGEALTTTIQETLKESPEPILIIASSDMNHYESQQIAERKDKLAIDKILALDPQGLYETVRKERVSMCGIIPTTVMLAAARRLGATRAELVQHATSGDVTGNHSSVVGYASLIVA